MFKIYQTKNSWPELKLMLPSAIYARLVVCDYVYVLIGSVIM